MTERMRLMTAVGASLICAAAIAFAHGTAAGIGVLIVLVLAGFLVRRWWALLIALGPLAGLVYLEVSGYVGPQEEYADRPLLSPPGLAGLVWIAVFLLLGLWLGKAGEWLLRRS